MFSNENIALLCFILIINISTCKHNCSPNLEGLVLCYMQQHTGPDRGICNIYRCKMSAFISSSSPSTASWHNQTILENIMYIRLDITQEVPLLCNTNFDRQKMRLDNIKVLIELWGQSQTFFIFHFESCWIIKEWHWKLIFLLYINYLHGMRPFHTVVEEDRCICFF